MKLSNANATETTKKVYAYICDTYGNGIISGSRSQLGLTAVNMK